MYHFVDESGRFSKTWKGGFAMLIGEYTHSVDTKGRLIMPAKFRDDVGEAFYITISAVKGQCLKVYTKDGWDEFFAKVSAIKESDKIAVKYKRTVLANSAECCVDKQGRILIPEQLLRFADIDKDVTVVGQGTYIELWNSDKWTSYSLAEDEISEEEFSQHLAMYDL